MKKFWARKWLFSLPIPAELPYTPSRLTSILTQLNPKYRNAVEFRHQSWWRESVYTKFRERGLSFCSVSAPRLPDDLVRTSEVIYVRLHGRSRWYRHDYTPAEITEWARKIINSGAREGWIYFDNDRDAFAIKNAKMLADACRERGAQVA